VANGRQGGLDAAVVGDVALLVQRHVEVDADQDAFYLPPPGLNDLCNAQRWWNIDLDNLFALPLTLKKLHDLGQAVAKSRLVNGIQVQRTGRPDNSLWRFRIGSDGNEITTALIESV
jgi:hypothetical protein